MSYFNHTFIIIYLNIPYRFQYYPESFICVFLAQIENLVTHKMITDRHKMLYVPLCLFGKIVIHSLKRMFIQSYSVCTHHTQIYTSETKENPYVFIVIIIILSGKSYAL